MAFSVPLVACLFAALAAGGSLSYRSYTRPEAERAFYRDGGASARDQRVHLHVPASRLLGEPKTRTRGAGGAELWIFDNKSVPLVVAPSNVYFRKILDRAERGDRLCVKGEVRDDPAGRGRYVLRIHSVKRAHDEDRAREPKRKGQKP